MLKGLTELETVESGINKKPLVKRKGAVISTSGKVDARSVTAGVMGVQGLAAFVEEKQFCPDCKSHMILAKNKKGTSYTRCSNKNCKHMEYLTPDLMNWYINLRNVVCPKHDGGEIRGILGKYGPCVRCDKGHFLGPDDI
jgi:ribosomal protein S27AE